jgi:hypothetical protein
VVVLMNQQLPLHILKGVLLLIIFSNSKNNQLFR